MHGFGCGHFYDNGIWLSHTGSLHYHHAGCGHYYYDGLWNNTSCYHIHGPGCGHHYYDGRWNDFAHTHIHSDHCGHLYDGTQWLIVSSDDHIHGANCGHYRFSGRWHAYPREYYTMGRANSLFFFVDLGDYRNRNLPDWAYEEYLADYATADIFRSTTPLAKAYAAFAKSRYYDSLVQFRLASQIEPDNGLIYLARAQAQIAVKDYRAAFEDLKKGMTLLPEWADVRINLSEIYSDTIDLDTHISQLEAWVERYPRDYKAHFVLGYFYYFHQEYDAAKNELQYALSWNDQLEPALNLIDHILSFEAEQEVLTMEQDLPPSNEVEITTE
ncbi:tetratricopeptide repeat domain protein [Verrucomicrobiia bacterium DG1235]|nr:tetratricopeptide repeat domain protein [Verrucomicrobiae bacterium DG1235]